MFIDYLMYNHTWVKYIHKTDSSEVTAILKTWNQNHNTGSNLFIPHFESTMFLKLFAILYFLKIIYL